MLDNAYHVEALLLILTLKKKNVKNYVYKLKAFMHIHRAKDDTLNSCIRLTFEINLVPRVLSYSSLTRVSVSLSLSLQGSDHVAPEQNYFCETLSSGRSLQTTVAR